MYIHICIYIYILILSYFYDTQQYTHQFQESSESDDSEESEARAGDPMVISWDFHGDLMVMNQFLGFLQSFYMVKSWLTIWG